MRALVVAAALTLQSTTASSIQGTWRSPGGNSIITIDLCGSFTLCGTVKWATDKARKDAARSTNQLVGTQVITNLKQDSKGAWHGKLLIPDKKMRVNAKIQRVGPKRLKVSGCAAGKALCKADIWTSFSRSLPTDTSAPAPR